MDNSAVSGDAVADPEGLALPLVLAVGLPLGALHLRATVHGTVRAGGELHQLDLETYFLWGAFLEARSLDAVLALIPQAGQARAEQQVQSMVNAGLLVHLDEAVDRKDLLDHHRLLPTGVGIGNRAEDEGTCFIDGRIPGRRLRVDAVVYNVWGASTTQASLRDVIDTVAGAYDRDRSEIAAHLVANIPVIMRSGAAFLDLA